jgi:AcrR family transcriptional regulator
LVNSLSNLSTLCIVGCVPAAPEAKSPPTEPKARGRRATRASGDDRERAILETAERLLEERPLSEISVDDLAKGAGISRPTFYFYFPSKDAVVLSIIDRLVADAAEGREEIFAALAAAGPRAGLRKALENLYGAFRSRPGVVRAGSELRASNQEARDLWADVMESWVADVTAVIEFQRERGAAPPGLPAREMAIALVQMNERAQYATLLGEAPSLDSDRVLDVLIEIWLLAIYGTAEPA